MPRPLVAIIDIAAMESNLALARRLAPRSKAWAVVKANAYGHGLERAIRGFAAADGLALIEPEGAQRLRDLGWSRPVLLLEGCFDGADLLLAQEYAIDIAVHCDEQIGMLETTPDPRPVNVHLKMNSGMNRLGFRPEAFAAAHARLCALDTVGTITLMTHFANADDAGNEGLSLEQQWNRFRAGCEGLAGECSIANSAVNLLHPDAAADWVRPGVMLYGGSPGGRSAEAFGLHPVMTLASEIIGIQQLQAGEAVGYGSRFIAERPITVGVVACGYADGYPRHAPNGTPVIVDGVRTAIVGRVSMDMLTVDLTPVPGARVGSSVVLWGRGLPVDEVAHAAGTIGYELMCAVALRVRMVEAQRAGAV